MTAEGTVGAPTCFGTKLHYLYKVVFVTAENSFKQLFHYDMYCRLRSPTDTVDQT
jgi:hypothetical protein